MVDNVVEFVSRPKIKVEPVVDNIDDILPKVINILKPAIENNNRNASLDDVVGDILSNQSLMWAVYIEDTLAAAFTTSVVKHPQRRTLFIEFMGGVEMNVWMRAALNVLKLLAKEAELSGIEADGRIGFSKFAESVGFKETYRHYEMEI
tara:strand:- start:357 stop:803 length:447 start_codon:yes stop_codon:yes gene_type:complete